MTWYPLIDVYQAGEDLEETEEEEDEEAADDDRLLYGQPSGSQDTSALQPDPEAAEGSLARILADSQPSKSAVSETSPLLPRSSSVQRSRTRRRRVSVSHGDATVGQAVLMVCRDSLLYNMGVCLPFLAALEVVRRDWGFVFGESVSLTAIHTFVAADYLCQLFQWWSFVFFLDTFGYRNYLPIRVFTSRKDQVCCIREFRRYVYVRGGGYSTFLTDFRPGRRALRSMDALRYSHVYHNLTNWLCRCIYDIRRGEPAKLCLCCYALHIVHPSPISHSHATHHIPPHGAYTKSGEA